MAATQKLDPPPAGMERVCEECGGPYRTDQDTGQRRCDLHPTARVITQPRRIPQLCWELDRQPVACPGCSRSALWVLLHPPIPSTVLVLIDLDTEELDHDGCVGCGEQLPIPDRFEKFA